MDICSSLSNATVKTLKKKKGKKIRKRYYFLIFINYIAVPSSGPSYISECHYTASPTHT